MASKSLSLTEYLPLAPVGVGTLEVESLRSYLCRLAALHGVTYASFVKHVGSMCKMHRDKMALGRFTLQTTTGCGIGSNVGLLLKVLGHLTGQEHLQRLTLLELDKVLSGGQGLVKPAREWCPSCYEEHRRNSDPYYDRLLWIMQPVIRCPIHQVELVSNCGHCGERQRHYHKSGRIELCYVCSKPLIDGDLAIRLSRKPQFGEADCCAIVSSISTGELYVQRRALHIFRAELAKTLSNDIRRKDACEIMDLPFRYLLQRRKKPFQFSTLLRFVHDLDLRLVDLLTSPIEAAHAAGGLLSQHVDAPVKRYTRLTKAQRSRIKQRILRELGKPSGVLLLSKRALCLELGITVNAFRYAGGELLEHYEGRRAQAVIEARKMAGSAMRDLFSKEYEASHRAGRLSTQKAIAIELAKKCSTTIRHARMVVKEMVDAQQEKAR